MGNKSRHLRRDRKHYRQLCRRVREYVKQARKELTRWELYHWKFVETAWYDAKKNWQVGRWRLWHLEIHFYWDPYDKLNHRPNAPKHLDLDLFEERAFDRTMDMMETSR